MSNQLEGNVIVTSVEETIETTSCSTSQLSSLFASFLVGGSVNEMAFQKYFVLYRGDPLSLRAEYEQNEGSIHSKPLIDRVDVRASSTSRDSDGIYYATLIGTIQGDGLVNLSSKNSENLSLALVAGDKILAFTTFDEGVYRKLCTGSRAEIKWKLQLKHVTRVIQKITHGGE